MEKKTNEQGKIEESSNLAWEEIRTEHIVQDEWIDLRRSAYRFPDGKVFEPFYSYSRRDYVVIVATDEQGDYLCVRQFRQGIKEVTTEFPAGGIEWKEGIPWKESIPWKEGIPWKEDIPEVDGRQYGTGRDRTAAEDALEAAKRELLEETGCQSDEWKHLLTIPSNATITDNYTHIFQARNCRKAGEQHLDETEFLHVRKHSAAEIEEMIKKGQFQQSIHVLSWLLSQRG